MVALFQASRLPQFWPPGKESGGRVFRRHWAAALSLVALVLPLMPGFALAQNAVGWRAIKRGAGPAKAIHVLSVPAPAGAVAVRGRYRSDSLPLIDAIGKEFPSKEKMHVASDDFGSFGRFCDEDDPFHVVIQEGGLTLHDKLCWRRRFPAGTPQPEAFVVGELRVVFVVNKSNPIESLTFAGIRKALNEKGKRLHWPDIGGVGSAVVRCCGPSRENLGATVCPKQVHDPLA